VSPPDGLASDIAEQPEVVRRLLGEAAGPVAALADELRRRPPRYALIAARGTSDNAARYAQHVLGLLCGLPVALASPSLYTIYGSPPRLDGALVIGISQSGEGPDVRAVVEDGARQRQVTVAITNDPDSPLATAAGHVIPLGAGREHAVAATKTYMGSLAAVALIAAAIASDDARRAELEAAPGALDRQLGLEEGLAEAIDRAAGWDRCAVVARGANYATAFEAALKVRELSGMAAEAHSAADLLHGPIAALGAHHPVLGFVTSGPAATGMRELLDELRTRGAELVVAAPPGVAAPHDVLLPLVETPDWLSPLVAIVPAQRLAAALAERLGVDVRAPFGLAKVTRTE
jgi:glucosamine--fructose-6-phosphate aminotransferase (isomerizing)